MPAPLTERVGTDHGPVVLAHAGYREGEPMKISTMLSYSGGFRQAAAQVAEFEKAGLDLVWVAEA